MRSSGINGNRNQVGEQTNPEAYRFLLGKSLLPDTQLTMYSAGWYRTHYSVEWEKAELNNSEHFPQHSCDVNHPNLIKYL